MRAAGLLVWGLALASGCSDVNRVTVCGAGASLGTGEMALISGTSGADYLAIDATAAAAVVGIELPMLGADEPQFCSGVRVAPGWVLSAAHCAEGVTGTGIQIVTGPDAGSADGRIAAEITAQHPTLDLMLLRTDASASVAFAVAADAPNPGELVQLAGYGLDESGGHGRREFVVETVSSLTDEQILVDGQGLSGACSGDSGGPLLSRGSDGAPRVMGVLERGSASCATIDRYTRVDVAADWVASYVGASVSDLGCGLLTHSGRCFNGVATWCEGQTRHAERCAADERCTWDDGAEGYRCVAPADSPCDGIDEQGVCAGDTMLRCEQGRLETSECGRCGAVCRRRPSDGAVACATPTVVVGFDAVSDE